MPDFKVYIRNSNLEKWLAIEKPSDWINTILENSGDTSSYGKVKETPVSTTVVALREALGIEEEDNEKDERDEPDPRWPLTKQAGFYDLQYDTQLKQLWDPATKEQVQYKVEGGVLKLL